MNEAQLKAVIRQAFALQNTADKAVINVDQVLARSMAIVKSLVQTLPQEGLLRNRSWRQLEPLVKDELAAYADKLNSSLQAALVEAEPGMEGAAIRQAQLAGADFGPEIVRVNPPGMGVSKSVELALNSRVGKHRLEELFTPSGKTGISPATELFFKSVDTRVRKGIIQGWTTEEIADLIAVDATANGVKGINLNAGETSKSIRSQAMAIARTGTQDMARQVKEEVYEANAEALEEMVWEWTTALDSRTCPTCMPLDGRRWGRYEKGRPKWPLHPNCRCQAVLIDPEDPYWNQNEKVGQQIRPKEDGPYKDGYKTPIKINGKEFYRKAVTFTSDTPPPRYSDLLARWATGSNTSLVEAMGPTRAAYFKREFDRFNRDPQQILESMLTGKPGAQRWIPVEDLRATPSK